MATAEKSKREGDDEGPLELPVPDFDEAAWKKKEIRSAFQAVVVTSYGFALGILAALVQRAVGNYASGWIVLLVGIAGLRLVFKAARIDIKGWKPKDWFGTYFTLFFAFLALWYLLINPPFA